MCQLVFGVDIFTLQDRDYLAILGAYSNYPAVEMLMNGTSYKVILALKAIFLPDLGFHKQWTLAGE